MIRCSCHGLHGCVPVGAEGHAQLVGELPQLGPPLGDSRHDLGERLAPAGPDLDLGRDQLPDEMRLELGALRGGLEVLEAVRQRESLGVDDRELLLDRNREILRRLVFLARAPE